ncbi:MAG: hypothetical protein Q8S44_08340 [Flavobacteriaceae bacterium]|nr:hypothetical protein [Flavobacteriaceae bacterium]
MDPEVVKDISEKHDRILLTLIETLSEAGIKPLNFWLWQGRARGKPGDDIDIYVQIENDGKCNVSDLDFLNNKMRNKYGYSDYHWICDGLLMDTRLGIGLPPEEPYIDFSLVKRAYINGVYFPQWQNLTSRDMFNIIPEYIIGKVKSFMISCPGENMLTGYNHSFYRQKVDEVIFKPRCEVLFGNESHDITHERIGTQPFGSYVRGHLDYSSGIIINGEWVSPDIDKSKHFVTVQQYYKSDLKPGIDFLPQQVDMTALAIRKLIDTGLISQETQVNLEDHSHPWDKYICQPFVLIPAKKIVDLYDKLPKHEVLSRWRIFSEYGKTYTNKDKALNCFNV